MKKLFASLVAAVFVFVICGSFAYAEEQSVEKRHCSDKTMYCMKDQGKGKSAGHVMMGQCWYWIPPGCDDCNHTDYGKYTRECNEQYASECGGKCWACDTSKSGGSGVLTCYDSDGHGHAVGAE